MKKYFVAITVILFLSMQGCQQSVQQKDEQFKISYPNLDITGHLYTLHSYGDYIIGQFWNTAGFCVLDSNYQHVAAIESKLNSLRSKIEDVYFYNSDMLLRLDNNKLIIFDSNFNRKSVEEVKLNKFKNPWIFYFNDTAYVNGGAKYYAIVDNYQLLKVDMTTLDRKRGNSPWDAHVYSDSAYNVYVCANGEFGGCIHFCDKKTSIVYSLPTYFGELLYYKKAYHLIHSFYDWSMYIKISDPKKLYKTSLATHNNPGCNCQGGKDEYYGYVDSAKRKQWENERGVRIYFDPKKPRLQTLKSFIYRDGLYSLCMSDSSFHILKHVDDSVKYVQSFPKMEKRIKVYTSHSVCMYKNKIVIGLNGTFWRGGDSGLNTQVNQTGLIVIDTSKITISLYEFYKELPYKEPNH